MKGFEMLLVGVLLACVPMAGQVEAKMKNKGDYQLSTKFGTEVGMTTMSNVISMRDAASGLPTGKRMHKPFVITKELDNFFAAAVPSDDEPPGGAEHGAGFYRSAAVCLFEQSNHLGREEWHEG